jgi:hypothetical protein
MRTLIAYLAGLATAYALLALYRTLPPFPDPDWSPTEQEIIARNREEFIREQNEPWFPPIDSRRFADEHLDRGYGPGA